MAKFFYSEQGLLIDAAKDEELTLREAKVAALLDLARQVGAVARALEQAKVSKPKPTPAKKSSSKAKKSASTTPRRAART